MIKVDSSCSGYGVFECSNEFDIQKINSEFLKVPFLVQKKIMGTELDLSEFYLNSQLINFCYCVIEKVVRKFGASSLRN